PELLVDDWWVHEDEELLAAWRAALLHQLEGPFREALGKLTRVRDRRGGADERRIRSVVAADALQPPQDVAEMAAEDAAIRVQLVDDDELQVFEELRPARMVRQDAGVHHIGITQNDMGTRADRPSCILGRIAVVGED